MIRYNDEEIAALVNEPKALPAGRSGQRRWTHKRGHSEQQLELVSHSSRVFRLILRQGRINRLDFSVILAVQAPTSNQVFRLRRYNGRSHQHTNQIEGDRFFDFHIHTATQRYQELGMREDGFAEPSDRYSDFEGAWQCLLADANIDPPMNTQAPLL